MSDSAFAVTEPQTLDDLRLTCEPNVVVSAYESWPWVFRTALTIRLLETKFLDLFAQGRINGTVHTCVGQELIGPAVARCLQESDFVVSNHRGHGHFVACTGDDSGLVRELMGRTTGVCGGIGGSQHLYGPNFLSNGIQGGMMPIAAGIAMASQRRANEGITVAFIGDGTLGEGVVYEALNVAGVFRLPLLVVLENNGYAQSTATNTTTAGDVAARCEGFGARYFKTTIWNPHNLIKSVENAIAEVRAGNGPVVLDIGCYRLNSHSKGDDNRDPAAIEHYRRVDPLHLLMEAGLNEVSSFVDAERTRLDAVIQNASSEPERVSIRNPSTITREPTYHRLPDVEQGRVNQFIHAALEFAMANDERVLLLGEDICDRTAGANSDYGGAFKVTKGLSTRFPTRVLNFPISEATIVGSGIGLALRGFRPVVEIMFGDFLTLCLDQLFQHAAKFQRMFHEQVRVPLIVRTPMGGKRGYGPTHSQSIEKFFVGIPGLQVVTLNDRIDPRELYRPLFGETQSPTLVIENKVLYTRTMRCVSDSPFRIYRSNEMFPTLKLTMDDLTPDVTLFCYGEMLETAEKAAILAFRKQEIITEILCPTCIHPLPVSAMLPSIRASQRLVTLEEGPSVAGVGAELVASVLESGVRLRAVRRLGNNDIVPSAIRAEAEVIPGVDAVVESLLQAFSQ